MSATPPHPDSNTPRTLILHAGALGDCVLMLHFADALRRTLGGRLTVAARSRIVHWAKRRGLIDEAVDLESLGAHRWYAGSLEPTPHDVRFFAPFAQIVSFLGGPDAEISRNLARIYAGPIHAMDLRPDPSGRNHITEQWAERLENTGPSFPLRVPIAAFQNADPFTSPERERGVTPCATPRTVLIHPGSGSLRKCCPLDAMETLMSVLRMRGFSPTWMIGPDEIERHGSTFVKRLEKTARVLYEESVEAAADVVARAEAFAGFDAGMTHVAALAGVDTVALFGPTDPTVWRPLGRSVAVVAFPSPSEPIDCWASRVVERLTFAYSPSDASCSPKASGR